MLAALVARAPVTLLAEQAKAALATQPRERSRWQRARVATVAAAKRFPITYGALTTLFATAAGLYVGFVAAAGTTLAKVGFGALAAIGGYFAIPLVVFLVCWTAIMLGADLDRERAVAV